MKILLYSIANNIMNIYKEHGFENRREYLQNLADEYDVDINIVFALAELLGKNEDFDGLVSELQDYSL